MKKSVRIALIGDFRSSVTAHRVIPVALDLAAGHILRDISASWLSTEMLATAPNQLFSQFDGFWCVPASPYRNTSGAMKAISFARKNHRPFLGTCGGYQHAVLEYAQNALGITQAANAEIDPDTKMPLIGPLSCALVEKHDWIKLNPSSRIRQWASCDQIHEGYHCSYGVNPRYLQLFEDTELNFCGFDNQGDPRAFELQGHRFFVGTAFQPERSALHGQPHFLIVEFLRHCA